MRNAFKKLICLATIVGIITSISGCSSMDSFIKQGVSAGLVQRINENIAIAGELKDNGLLSQAEYDNIVKHLNDLHSTYELGDGEKLSGEASETFKSAVVAWWTPNYDESKAIKLGIISQEEASELTTEEKTSLWNEAIATNQVANYKDKLEIPLINGGTVKPLVLIDNNLASSINAKFGYEVYVLDSSKFSEGITGQPLDEVFSASKFVEVTNEFPSEFMKYFKPATEVDSEGNEKVITLLDTTLAENQLVQVTSGVDDYVKELTVNKRIDSWNTDNNYEGYVNEPGKDMVLNQGEIGGTSYPNIMALRLQEFNKQAANKIIETLGSSPDKYIFDAANKRAYLMEYPVHYIDEISQDNDEYKMNFSESNLGINLKTGKMIKYKRAYSDDKGLHGVEIETEDNYLTIEGSNNLEEMNQTGGKSSFVIYGDTDEEDKLVIIDNEDETKQRKSITARIVLRDYLEYTYMPEIVSGENIVALGRKIRIKNFEGTINTIVGEFYDKNGDRLENSSSLYVYDFVDSEKLLKENVVNYVGLDKNAIKIKEENVATESDTESEATESDTEKEEKETESKATESDSDKKDTENKSEEYSEIKYAAAKIDRLEKVIVDKINPSLQFPGKMINRVDNNENKLQLFYGMTLKSSMFDTALFSGWINNSDESANSVHWWLKWLSDNGYKYTFNLNELEGFLYTNYKLDLAQDGITVLDLNVIAKIQSDLNKKDRYKQNSFIRTAFIILGYTLLGYAIILLLAWSCDTNLDLGVNVLSKLTFGSWVAIKDEEDLNLTSVKDKRYMTIWNMVSSCVIIAVVGVVLINIDIMSLVGVLIKLIANIVKWIENLI